VTLGRETFGKRKVSSETFARALKIFGREGLLNLVALMGNYASTAAMLCVMALQKHGLKPSDGEVLVTGAAGGVGSFAITLLNKLGFMCF
jgi:NADPH-dependent curcumin reductase CurA